jgi:hypothetical protein
VAFVDVRVVALGVWCDLAGGEGAIGDSDRQLTLRVAEFAVLSDGRRLTLHDERGFDTRLSGTGDAPVDPWDRLSLEQLERNVRTTVLGDDAEATGDEHPWEWLAGLLRASGVDASPGELARLPYDVVFSPRLRQQLSDPG